MVFHNSRGIDDTNCGYLQLRVNGTKALQHDCSGHTDHIPVFGHAYIAWSCYNKSQYGPYHNVLI